MDGEVSNRAKEIEHDGGSNDLENRVTLCAFHHLRGVHAGVVHCAGTAPDHLQIALGVRAGARPLAVYTSHDRLISPTRD